jgi:hypothetical protein
MPVLKYLDTATGTYKTVYGPPGPAGKAGGGAPVIAAYTRKGALSLPISTQVEIPWDTVETAAAGIGFSTLTDFAVQADGTYLVTASLTFLNAVNTGYYQLRIIKNGAIWDYTSGPTDDVIGYQIHISRAMVLVVGDVIQIAAYCNPASSIVTNATYNINNVQIVRIDGGLSNADIPTPVELPAGADLNSYVTNGVFTQSQTADAQSGTNYPPTLLAGLLEVFNNNAGSANMVWQRYTNYAGNVSGGGFVYERGSYNGVWTAWELIGGQDTGWIDIAISSGFTSQGTEKPQVRLINGIVYSRGGWSGTGITVSANTDIGTVPAGYRPTQNVIWRAGSASGAAVAELFVQSSGVVQVRMGPTSTYVMLGASWLTS